MFGFLLNDLKYLSKLPELLELNKVELNEEGKAASLCFTRAQRFIEGYCRKGGYRIIQSFFWKYKCKTSKMV